MSNVYLASAVRSPIGRFGGALKDVSPVDLAAHVMKAALDRAGVQGSDLDFYIFGNVLRAGHGQLIPRQAAMKMGIPNEVDGMQLDMVCSSGMMALMNAAALIRAGDADVILAGGVESMSQTGFFLSHGARWGYKYLNAGAEPLADLMQRDGLSDPQTGEAMGILADRLAAEYNYSRARIEEAAALSHARAVAARAAGHFAAELAPIPYKAGREMKVLDFDEGVRPETTADSLAKLRPAFGKEGVLTAGTSSQISDGGAAVVVASEAAVKRLGLKPIARLLGSAWSAGEPWRFPEAPVPAVRKMLDKLGMEISDFDLFENNEAFALNNLLFTDQLGVSPDVLNVHGGAVSLGHPIGASGARIVVTLAHALHTHGKDKGIAAICHGTGGGTALAIERV